MADPTPDTSASELAVLKTLWERGPGTVREINERLTSLGFRWAYTTVQTLLGRLSIKGYVVCDKREPSHVYRASVSKDKLLKRRLGDLARDLCEGISTPLVHALVKGQKWSREELDDLRRVLDALAPLDEDAPRRPKGRTEPRR